MSGLVRAMRPADAGVGVSSGKGFGRTFTGRGGIADPQAESAAAMAHRNSSARYSNPVFLIDRRGHGPSTDGLTLRWRLSRNRFSF